MQVLAISEEAVFWDQLTSSSRCSPTWTSRCCQCSGKRELDCEKPCLCLFALRHQHNAAAVRQKSKIQLPRFIKIDVFELLSLLEVYQQVSIGIATGINRNQQVYQCWQAKMSLIEGKPREMRSNFLLLSSLRIWWSYQLRSGAARGRGPHCVQFATAPPLYHREGGG